MRWNAADDTAEATLVQAVAKALLACDPGPPSSIRQAHAGQCFATLRGLARAAPRRSIALTPSARSPLFAKLRTCAAAS
jgi:hypothetical protein